MEGSYRVTERSNLIPEEIGKPKHPSISPNKAITGIVLGALVGVIGVALLMAAFGVFSHGINAITQNDMLFKVLGGGAAAIGIVAIITSICLKRTPEQQQMQEELREDAMQKFEALKAGDTGALVQETERLEQQIEEIRNLRIRDEEISKRGEPTHKEKYLRQLLEAMKELTLRQVNPTDATKEKFIDASQRLAEIERFG